MSCLYRVTSRRLGVETRPSDGPLLWGMGERPTGVLSPYNPETRRRE